jgi:hypothetical protein
MDVTADMVLSMQGIQDPAVDVAGVIRSLGIQLYVQSLRECAGAMEVEGNSATIMVERSDVRVRQRFTMAHELGHVLLHRDEMSFRDADFTPFTMKEQQANNFAAELLMPAWMVRPRVGIWGADVKRLAGVFDVSTTAMTFRLKTLKLT